MKPTSNAEGNLVSKVLSVQFAPIAADSSLLRKAGIVLAGSALVAVCAHIALPLYFTPVPLTLQTLAVLLLGLLLSPRLAAATLAAYLIEGAVGLPVFAPSVLGVGGLAHLIGPTGGYLLAYPLAAAMTSFLCRRSQRGPIDISIAHSPDSDDAFMFYGLATNKVRVPGYRFNHTLCDIETLNIRARDEAFYDVTAISFHAYPYSSTTTR
jgi:hypothetical protein